MAGTIENPEDKTSTPGGVRKLRASLLLLAVGAQACTSVSDGGDAGLPIEDPDNLVEQRANSIYAMGRVPILPPTEDLVVGDVFALRAAPHLDEARAEGLHQAPVSRWTSLDVGDALDDEYRKRPSWPEGAQGDALYRDDPQPLRRRTVALNGMGDFTPTPDEVEAMIPSEVVPLLGAWTTPDDLVVSLRSGDAESYSLSTDALLTQLVDVTETEEGPRYVLKEERRRNLPLASSPETGLVYLAIVSEVLYIRTLDALVRHPSRTSDEPTSPEPQDPKLAAIERANALNETLQETGLGARIDGSLEFLTVADDALTLRRSWSRPLALAVRGMTLEVDAATGEVRRTGPLGIDLPKLASERVVIEEESEVLEERRRGAEVDADAGPRKGWSFGDYGLLYDGAGSELKIFVGGRLHLDAATFSADDDILDAFGEPDPGLKVRRAFLELGGAYRRYDFNFWLNFSKLDASDDGLDSDDVDFRNVFVGARNLPGIGGVRVGYFKEPFGLEEFTSSNDITFMERSLTDAFIEGRNFGVSIQRRFTGARRMTGAVGLFREMDNNLEFGDAVAITGRLTGAPILAREGRRVLHLGGSATYRDPRDDDLKFSSRPESAQAQVMANTGEFAVDSEVRIGGEVGAVFGSFSVQSEAIVAASDGGGDVGDPVFWSAYLMGSYVLTGEFRSYRERVGAFGTVHPDRPFWAEGAGAFELSTRYSYLDLDSAGIDGGRLHDWTLGLNWYLNDRSRVMINYIAAHPEGFGVEHILQARLQLTF